MNWTTEEVAKLAEERRKGEPFSAIARALGRTRNACVARADRDGLKTLIPCHTVNRCAYEIGKRLKGKHIRPRPTKLKPPKLASVALPAGALPPLNIDVMGLEPGMCRWPVSEERPHMFCGHRWHGEHGPYCATHMRMAHREEPPAPLEKFAAWLTRHEYRNAA